MIYRRNIRVSRWKLQPKSENELERKRKDACAHIMMLSAVIKGQRGNEATLEGKARLVAKIWEIQPDGPTEEEEDH